MTGLVAEGYPPDLRRRKFSRAGAAFSGEGGQQVSVVAASERGGSRGSSPLGQRLATRDSRVLTAVPPSVAPAEPQPEDQGAAISADADSSVPNSADVQGAANIWADELPDGLIVADANGVVVIFNRAAQRLTGISADQAIGKELPAALPLADGEGNCWWRMSRPYSGLSTRTRHPERSLFLANGTELLVTVGYVRRSRDGEPEQRGAVQRVTITLRSAVARARLERTRADLVSTVAHELRSPLTSVKGFTATLLDKWPRFTDDQKRLMLETVNADADRVTRLITELLDVSRIEASTGSSCAASWSTSRSG